VHRNLLKNYLRLVNNYSIAFRVMVKYRVRVSVWVINTQQHNTADVQRKVPKTTENSVIATV